MTEKVRIETELEKLVRDSNCKTISRVGQAMDYAVLGQGQRIRPILALRVAQMVSGREELALRAACAVELLHCASLIVDDLPCMDDDSERRGRPAVHVAFGESTALLAAFALVALAARTVLDQDCPPGYRPRQRKFQIALLRTLDRSGLIAGQMMDLSLSGLSREHNRVAMHSLKTVPLFELAVEAGIAYAEAAPAGLMEFGRNFGLAFQYVDDFRDGELLDPSLLQNALDTARDRARVHGPAARPLENLIDYLHDRAFAEDRRHR